MSVTREIVLPPLPVRSEASHKGTYGSVLIVAGSRGMSGAAALAGLGALRGGAGLVKVAVPAVIQSVVAGVEPSYLTIGLPEDDAGRIGAAALRALLPLAEANSAVAIGPGWGTSADLQNLSRELYISVPRPLVVDADGLNALAAGAGGLPKAPTDAARILTPHPGEFARLIGSDTKSVQTDREGLATEFAARHGVIVVLKGHDTVITDGRRLAVNTTGNSGMATGGTGDVLTGLIAALLAQGMAALDAAHLGCHLHGLAGDLAAADLSRPGLIASDLSRYLGKAWKQLGAV